MHFLVPFMYLELKILSATFSLNVKWLLLLMVRSANASFIEFTSSMESKPFLALEKMMWFHCKIRFSLKLLYLLWKKQHLKAA